MYGHLEGNAGKFARDPSGHLAIETGIFRKHGLEVSWTHVQGTEERYRRLEEGSAQISLVVGRASLQHFLAAKTTKILGCAMNRCPYYFIVAPTIARLSDLFGEAVACREAPTRHAPLAQAFQERTGLTVGGDVNLRLTNGDAEAFDLLVNGEVRAAILPRPFGFWAEARGFKRNPDWPDVVDDPMPITIETSARLARDRETELGVFLAAHREAIRYLKSHRVQAIAMLQAQFGHSPSFAARSARFTRPPDPSLS
jgi:ABC-type nitrate/sulfonate/bicarbonate transport system substrate-binding protein